MSKHLLSLAARGWSIGQLSQSQRKYLLATLHRALVDVERWAGLNETGHVNYVARFHMSFVLLQKLLLTTAPRGYVKNHGGGQHGTAHNILVGNAHTH